MLRLGFIGGYSIETVCAPLFHDKDMRILKEIPYLRVNVTNPIDGTKVQYNVG